MDHHPSWRLHKNPFWRVKHPSLKKAVAPNDARSIASGTTMYTAAGAARTATTMYLATNNVDDTKEDQMYVYEASEPVQGVCVLSLSSGKKLDHLGIKIQFIGRIDMVRTTFKLHGWNYFFSQFSQNTHICNRAMAFMKGVRITISFP